MIGLLLWLAREQHTSPALIGLVLSLGAVGAFVGAAAGARLSSRFGFGPTMLVTMTIGNGAPIAVIAAAGPATIVLLSAVFVVMGFGIALVNVHAVVFPAHHPPSASPLSSLRQSVVPDRLQGRVNASYRLISWGALPIGASLGSALATLRVALSPIPSLRKAPTG